MPSNSDDDHASSSWSHLGKVLAPIQWDWPRWLPRGFLTVLAGEPGAGKSLLCLRLAACYLRRAAAAPLPWPDDAPFAAERGKVIWCESEAGQALNVERARRLDLDLSQLLAPLANPLQNFKLDNPTHYKALMYHARRPDVRLIILDSLRGLRSAGAKAAPMSQIVHWLAELARLSGKPVLLTHHLRKRTNFDAAAGLTVDSLLGASAVAQSARVIWALDSPDPAHPHHRRLAVIKSNLARFPAPLGLRADEDGLHFGPPPQSPTAISELERAARFLRDLLAAGPLPFDEIEKQSRAAGHAFGTIRRAKKRLDIASIRPPGKNAWYWSLHREK